MEMLDEDRPTIVVVGGGASGLLTTLHLARRATTDGRALRIVVVDPDPLGGPAFSTPDDAHLLNVPAFGMSAFVDDPGHFAAWRAERTGAPLDPQDFAPRGQYGRYLTESVATALAESAGRVTLNHRRHRVDALDVEGRTVRVRLDDGSELIADALVVATGLPAPATSWAPEELRRSSRFVADPWAPGALEEVAADTDSAHGDVLIVGSGLTMVDVATTLARGARADRSIHAVSRSGELPRRHADGLQPPVVPDVESWGADLVSIVREVETLLGRAVQATGDWRPGVDGLRYRVQELWGRLDERDRKEFLTTHAGRWNRLRHRIPGPTARRIETLRSAGILTLGTGRIIDAREVAGGVRVVLRDGSHRDVGWVVNCTGPHQHVRDLRNPLLDDLIRERPGGPLAVPATGGMGFWTEDGRLVGASGNVAAPIWVLGALRRGELWESTAVPEIRGQATQVAAVLLDPATGVVPAPTRPTSDSDPRGPRR